MRAAVVDIGTNSTRLLIADVTPDGSIAELVRRSVVTRLGAGVDAGGALSPEGCERVYAALADFRREIDAHREGDPMPNLAVMTSAVREAHNGAAFAATVRDRFDLNARILSGDEEARMTFLGAMSGRPHGEAHGPATNAQTAGGSAAQESTAHEPDEHGSATHESVAHEPTADKPAAANNNNTTTTKHESTANEPTVVIDIGGGSTEFIVGVGYQAGFHTSLPAGVVRMSERHIHSDPPEGAELRELAADVRTIFHDGLPVSERASVTRGIAVAGTATSAAAIDQELDPYDPARVHGYPLLLATVEMLLARLADMDEPQRRQVVGLHPDRAPTIVAGMVLLSEAMRAFDLDEVEVSEHDILHGGVLTLARAGTHGT